LFDVFRVHPETIKTRESLKRGLKRLQERERSVAERLALRCQIALAEALALITSALFSHRTPPDREKREKLVNRFEKPLSLGWGECGGREGLGSEGSAPYALT
jgi:hypothetical protein